MGAPRIEPGDWSFRLTSPPVAEPITLAQAKLALRVADDLTDDDGYISTCISAARSYLEKSFDVKIMPQKWELLLQNFPRAERIRFPFGPIQTVDYFHYLDTGFNTQSLVVGANASADVLVRLAKKPAELVLPFGKVWPAVILQTADPIAIGLSMGYLTGGSPELLPLPPEIVQAMFLLVDHWYENRSAITLGTLMKSDPIAIGVQSLMSVIGHASYN